MFVHSQGQRSPIRATWLADAFGHGLLESGMKRHPALVALSHDHHEILLVARLLRRGGATVAGGRPLDERRQCQVVRQFLDGLRTHFRVEEGALQVAASSGEPHTGELLQAAAGAHRHLERMLAAVRCGTATGAELRQLGECLHNYVRGQERDLFQELQRVLSEAALAQVGLYLAREHRPGACHAPAHFDHIR